MAIVSGRVKVFKSTPAGKEIILEIFGAGDPLGAVAVYERVPFMASALTLEDTQCLRIEQSAFFRLLEQDPELVRGLLSGLTIRLAELTRRLAELTGARVEVRFARLFLKLCDQIGRPDHGGLFVAMPLSRQELADLTGTTIETAIRIMSRWQRDGVLHTEKDGFVILDRAVPRRSVGKLRAASRTLKTDQTSVRDTARAASTRGATSQRMSESTTAAAVMPRPPVKRNNASDAAPKAAVPSIASSAPVRAASTGLINVAPMRSRDADPERSIEAAPMAAMSKRTTATNQTTRAAASTRVRRPAFVLASQEAMARNTPVIATVITISAA